MEKFQILEHILPGYTHKYLSAQYGLDEMPLLDAIEAKYKDSLQNIDMSEVYLFACLHMLEPQFRMLKKLISIGFFAKNIFLLPKVYSANESVIDAFEELGCTVFEEALSFPLNQSFDAFHEEQCKKVLSFVLQNFTHAKKLVLLDDGGMLIKTFSLDKRFTRQFKGKVDATEQTASGKNILLQHEQTFFIDSVASSVEKIQIETGYIIRLSHERVQEYFKLHEIVNPKILIKGLGPIGQTLYEELTTVGFDCVGYDKKQGKFNSQLNEFDVIVAATGDKIINKKNLPKLKRGCHLISISSSDREYPAAYLRSIADTGKSIHDTFWNAKYDVYLANGGFPITFYGNRIECLPLEMDVTMMKLFESMVKNIIGRKEIKSSVNYLYPNLWLYRQTIWQYACIAGVIFLCIVRLIVHDFDIKAPPDVFSVCAMLMLFCSCIAGIRWIWFFRKLERL